MNIGLFRMVKRGKMIETPNLPVQKNQTIGCQNYVEPGLTNWNFSKNIECASRILVACRSVREYINGLKNNSALYSQEPTGWSQSTDDAVRLYQTSAFYLASNLARSYKFIF